MAYSETSTIVAVIKELSSCKYFYMEYLSTVTDTYLENRRIKLDKSQRQKLMKKMTRTLENLGYRENKGVPAKVRISRE